jgi:hypothetical protein
VCSVYGEPRWMRLGAVGGVWGRHCGLSAGVSVVLSVVSRFGHESSVFREGAVILVQSVVITVCHGAGRCWRRDGLSMPCWRARRGELDDAQVHRNAMRALHALGGSIASDRRGRGGVLSGSEVAVPRGIDHTCAEGLYGEVTSPGAVGAVSPKLGVHGGLGYGHGGVECCWRVAAKWGREGESAGVAITCWGSRAAPGR